MNVIHAIETVGPPLRDRLIEEARRQGIPEEEMLEVAAAMVSASPPVLAGPLVGAGVDSITIRTALRRDPALSADGYFVDGEERRLTVTPQTQIVRRNFDTRIEVRDIRKNEVVVVHTRDGVTADIVIAAGVILR